MAPGQIQANARHARDRVHWLHSQPLLRQTVRLERADRADTWCPRRRCSGEPVFKGTPWAGGRGTAAGYFCSVRIFDNLLSPSHFSLYTPAAITCCLQLLTDTFFWNIESLPALPPQAAL